MWLRPQERDCTRSQRRHLARLRHGVFRSLVVLQFHLLQGPHALQPVRENLHRQPVLRHWPDSLLERRPAFGRTAHRHRMGRSNKYVGALRNRWVRPNVHSDRWSRAPARSRQWWCMPGTSSQAPPSSEPEGPLDASSSIPSLRDGGRPAEWDRAPLGTHPAGAASCLGLVMHPRTLHSTSGVDAHFHWKRLTLTSSPTTWQSLRRWWCFGGARPQPPSLWSIYRCSQRCVRACAGVRCCATGVGIGRRTTLWRALGTIRST